MSDQIDLKAVFTADDEASPVIRNLMREVRKFEALTKRLSNANLAGLAKPSAKLTGITPTKAGADLRASMAFQAKMTRQKQAETRQAEKAVAAEFKQRLTFANRITRQKTVEHARDQRQIATRLRQSMAFQARMLRQRQAEAREVERQDARRESAHRREMARIDREGKARRRAFQHMARTAGGGIRDAGRGLGTTAAVGTAAAAYAGRSILRREADVDAAEKDAQIYGGLSSIDARKLRDTWAGPMGVELGASAAEMLTGYTDALKAGIPETDAKAFAAFSVKVAEMWSLPVELTNEILGGVKAIQTADGSPFQMSAITSWANTLQDLAAKLSTTPEKLLEYNRQAAGGAALLGMSQEASLAFGAASTTLGNRAGESGSALDYLAGRVAAMPQLTRQDGIEGDRARKLMKSLGYGNAAGMERTRQADPDNFIFDMMERLNRIKDPRRQNEAVLALAGQEWLGEIGRMAKGIGVVREARAIQKASGGVDAIGSAWSIHVTKLGFVGKQVVSSFLGIVSEFGKVLGPLASEAGRYFIGWSKRHSKALGTNFWAASRGLIEGLLGREGSFRDLLESAFGTKGLKADPQAFYRFAKGIGQGIRELWNGLKWLGTAVKSFLTALGVDGSDPEKLGKLAAEALGLGLAAKAAAGPLGLIKDGLVALGAGLFTIVTGARALGMLGGGAAAAGAAGALSLPALLGVAVVGGALAVTIWNWDEIKAWWNQATDNSDAARRRRLEDRAAGKESWLEGVANSIIRAFGGDPAARARQQLGSVSGGSGQSGTQGYPGADRLTGADIGAAVAPQVGNGAMLDAIARAEGTAGRGDYNASLGYGKFLPGGREQILTGKTLDEIHALGLGMRQQPGNPNSSALGRYQITGSTMMDAAKALGMDPATTKFDAKTQDAMAKWVWGRRGPGAWEGFKRNPAELATAKANAIGAPTIDAGRIMGTLSAADIAERYSGMMERGYGRDTVNQFLQGNGHKIDAARTAWCSAFVHSALNSVGVKGTGSLTASSFRTWGVGVDPSAVQRDDVLVDHRGRSPGQTGAHVGLATGNTRQGKNGLEIEMISGNSGGRRMNGGGVERTWERADKIDVRRAASSVPSPQGLAAKVPSSSTSSGPQRGASLGGGGPVTININGANQSPEAIASAVERRMTERAQFRTHDMEYS